MTTLLAWLDGPFWTHLVAALLHTLWIGALAALAIFAALRGISANRADLRYAAALAALLATAAGGVLALAVLEFPGTADGPARDRHLSSSEIFPEKTRLDFPGSADGLVRKSQPPSIVNGIPGRTGPSAIPGSERAGTPALPGRTLPFLAAAWLIGAVLMLARMVRQVLGAGRLRRECRPLADPAAMEIIDDLRALFGVARRVTVWVGESGAFPCVVGAFHPALFLPASLLAAPPANLRAVLAHELAHIRRHDYLVNLIQMLIEALLFFNPFVWWLSRQVRLEREACCDALAAGATGEPRAYARALVAYAENLNLQSAICNPQFSGRSSSLLDRVRRLAVPGHRPALRLPWPSLFLFLVASALGLACIKEASDGAVALAAKVLTPGERAEKITEIQKEYGTGESGRQYGEKDKITVSGKVVPVDGGPLPAKGLYINGYVQRAYATFGIGIQTKPDGSFSDKVEYGALSFSFKVPGYAHVYAGPFQAEPGGRIENIRLELRQGFMGAVKVVTPQGRPVPNVRLQGYYNTPGTMHGYDWYDAGRLVTDEAGTAIVDDATTMSALMTGEAPGYEKTTWPDVKMEPNRPAVLVMKPARPVTGVVVAAADGRPVQGAQLRLVMETQTIAPNHVSSNNLGAESGPILATTGADGAFTLNTLNEKVIYHFLVKAKGYAPKILRNITAGQQNLKIELGPPLIVRGRVLGAERANKQNGKPVIDYTQTYMAENSGDTSTHQAELTIKDGVGTFEISDVWAGDLTIGSGNKNKTIKAIESMADVVLDLRPESERAADATSATREVVFKVVLPPGTPPTTSTLRVHYMDKDFSSTTYQTLDLPLVNGEARARLPVPNNIGYSGQELAGFWFGEKFAITVPEGAGPFEVAIPSAPAGAIYGELFEEDGSPARGVSVLLAEVKKAPGRENAFLNVHGKDGSTGPGDPNKFVLAPLPFGGTYAALARRDATFVASEPVTIDEKHPIVELKMTMPTGIALRGRVVDEAGRPVPRIRVQLSIDTPGMGWGGPFVDTGADGAFTFERVNTRARGTYYMDAFGPAHQHVHKEINPARAVELRMKAGFTLTGRVIDDETSKPLSGVEVYAQPELRKGESYTFAVSLSMADADDKTNARGEFRFTQLADRPYKIGCRAGDVVKEVKAEGGQAAPVELRVKLNDYEKQRRME